LATRVYESRAALLAAHELFRDINDRLAEKRTHPGETRMGFLCECPNAACVEQISMTGEEYRRLRASPSWFAVLPDEQHVFTEIDWIASVEAGYWIVEQSPNAAQIARADSRSEASSNGNRSGAAAP
jgi:hypothetical protein